MGGVKNISRRVPGIRENSGVFYVPPADICTSPPDPGKYNRGRWGAAGPTCGGRHGRSPDRWHSTLPPFAHVEFLERNSLTTKKSPCRRTVNSQKGTLRCSGLSAERRRKLGWKDAFLPAIHLVAGVLRLTEMTTPLPPEPIGRSPCHTELPRADASYDKASLRAERRESRARSTH